jgi:hypothetical protein
MSKLKELGEEMRTVFSGRTNTLDTLLPPLLFALVQALAGLTPAMLSALSLAFALMLYRLIRKQAWFYALSGFLLVALAVGFAWFNQSASSFFLPDLISSALLLLAALISIMVGRPLAAWTSHLTRAWPRAWYWLHNVRPAYNEVTWLWAGFIALRFVAQLLLYQNASALTLGWASTLLGWPVTLGVLVISYLYGSWRLASLRGPSVEEFLNDAPPPWQGQKRGF